MEFQVIRYTKSVARLVKNHDVLKYQIERKTIQFALEKYQYFEKLTNYSLLTMHVDFPTKEEACILQTHHIKRYNQCNKNKILHEIHSVSMNQNLLQFYTNLFLLFSSSFVHLNPPKFLQMDLYNIVIIHFLAN